MCLINISQTKEGGRTSQVEGRTCVKTLSLSPKGMILPGDFSRSLLGGGSYEISYKGLSLFSSSWLWRLAIQHTFPSEGIKTSPSLNDGHFWNKPSWSSKNLHLLTWINVKQRFFFSLKLLQTQKCDGFQTSHSQNSYEDL